MLSMKTAIKQNLNKKIRKFDFNRNLKLERLPFADLTRKIFDVTITTVRQISLDNI